MTKISPILLGVTVLVGSTFTFLSPLVFSAPPQVQGNGVLDTPARQALERVRMDAWLHKRIPHPACPNCFKVDDGLEGLFESVPGTDYVIARDIPDPAPLEPGEIRPDRHPETGEPLWYKGHQPFVGPTDEENISASLPVPLIAVKRIKYKHEDELFKIPGVQAVGVASQGILVLITPEKRVNRDRIPSALEGIPVIVEEAGIGQLDSHVNTYYRPLPVGAAIGSSGYGGVKEGTVGPHVSRDVSDVGSCCYLYSLTASHVIQDPLFSPSGLSSIRITQPAGSPNTYGWVGYAFHQDPCYGTIDNCHNNPSSSKNDTRLNPDAAAIGHPFNDLYPMYSPCNGSQKPVRRMQYGVSSYVNGPTGVIRIPIFSNCSNCLKNWGVYSHGSQGGLAATDTTVTLQLVLGENYKQGPVDLGTYSSQSGDSGGLIAWNQTRDVIGLHIGRFGGFTLYGVYTRLDFIKAAFYTAGVSFDHYWGTGGDGSAGAVYRPSYPNPPYDPLNPSPCSQ
jgi:hypothetical protein